MSGLVDHIEECEGFMKTGLVFMKIDAKRVAAH
jgi:hypothetical protein